MAHRVGQKIGIFGGTFNPIHIGHLIIAEAAREEYGLDKIIFVTASHPPHKSQVGIATNENRQKMVELAIADNPHFESSDVELQRQGPSYTVDTLRYFHEIFPDDTEFYFIVGTDTLLQLHTWKYIDELMELCSFLAALRPHYDENLNEVIRELSEQYQGKIYCLHTPELEISATDLRERLQQGKSIRYLVPAAVEKWLREHNVYEEEMMEEMIKADLQARLSAKRFAHTLGVAAAARQLAERYGEDAAKAYLAGLVHDCAKELSLAEMQELLAQDKVSDPDIWQSRALLHGPAGAVYAAEHYGIHDADILSAVVHHTMGKENMSKLEKIIFLADYIEPTRDFPGVEELRRMAVEDLDRAVLAAMDSTIAHLREENKKVHPQTLRARQSLEIEIRGSNEKECKNASEKKGS